MVCIACLKAVGGEFLEFKAHFQKVVACCHTGIHIGLYFLVDGMQLCLCRAYCGKVQFQFCHLIIVLGHFLQDVLCLELGLKFCHLLANVGQTIAVHYLSANKERLCQSTHHGIPLVQFANRVGLTCQSCQFGVDLSQSHKFHREDTVLLHHLVESVECQDIGRYFGEVFCEGLLLLLTGHLYVESGIVQGAVVRCRALQAFLKGDGLDLCICPYGKAKT